LTKNPADKSYVAIGVHNPKTPENMGIVLRAAGCYGADAIFYTGERYNRARKFFTDTKNIGSKIPVTGVDALLDIQRHNTQVIAVELVEGAVPLMDFDHPEQAYYLFGPEDGSLPQEVLNNCDAVVYIPTIGCMNLAATVNVVLYDRLAKYSTSITQERPVHLHRDTNNRTKI
jgi:tRNA(Leu) C34 or U34 (ribose-2'-O)-methylase TrmL